MRRCEVIDIDDDDEQDDNSSPVIVAPPPSAKRAKLLELGYKLEAIDVVIPCCDTVEAAIACLEGWDDDDRQQGKQDKDEDVSSHNSPLEQQLLSMGYDKSRVLKAVARNSTVEKCVAWLEGDGKSERSKRVGASSSSGAYDDDDDVRVVSSSSEETGVVVVMMTDAQKKAYVIKTLVDMGIDLETSVELAKESDSVERCLHLLESRRKDRQEIMASAQRRGGLFAMEDELLASGLEEVMRWPLEDRRESDLNDPLDIHYRVVFSQLHSAGGLTLLQPGGASSSNSNGKNGINIEYILNPSLIRRFRDKEAAIKAKYPDNSAETKYVLAWHGTSKENAEKIVEENFRLDACVRAAYGKAIYFTEFPNVGHQYATGRGGKGKEALLLCRLLPGRSLDVTGPLPGLAEGYDSHRVAKDDKGRGQMLLIYDMDQILPCYLIHL